MPAPALAPPETSGSDGSDGQRPGHARASHLKEVLRVMIHGLPVDLEIPFVDGIRGAHAAFLSSCGIPCRGLPCLEALVWPVMRLRR